MNKQSHSRAYILKGRDAVDVERYMERIETSDIGFSARYIPSKEASVLRIYHKASGLCVVGFKMYDVYFDPRGEPDFSMIKENREYDPTGMSDESRHSLDILFDMLKVMASHIVSIENRCISNKILYRPFPTIPMSILR